MYKKKVMGSRCNFLSSRLFQIPCGISREIEILRRCLSWALLNAFEFCVYDILQFDFKSSKFSDFIFQINRFQTLLHINSSCIVAHVLSDFLKDTLLTPLSI